MLKDAEVAPVRFGISTLKLPNINKKIAAILHVTNDSTGLLGQQWHMTSEFMWKLEALTCFCIWNCSCACQWSQILPLIPKKRVRWESPIATQQLKILEKPIQGVNYQAATWQQCLKTRPEIPRLKTEKTNWWCNGWMANQHQRLSYHASIFCHDKWIKM